MLPAVLGMLARCCVRQHTDELTLRLQMMETLGLEPGDLLQTKSTDLPPGQFIKLQPQDTNFLDISDPKAVLETAFRNFSCLTQGDIFTFLYNETTYQIAVLEVKPQGDKKAVSVQETDIEVDFAPPVGYVEPSRTAASGTSTPRSIGSAMAGKGGTMHTEGSMAQAINYAAIAPSSDTAAVGHAKASLNFSGGGQRLVAKKGGKGTATPTSTPGASTPVTQQGVSMPLNALPRTTRNRNGPQPLRLPPGKLFFGYEIKPLKNKDAQAEADAEQKQHFNGEGQSLRKKK
jgi:ubiquitin fusion degradation protein 1